MDQQSPERQHERLASLLEGEFDYTPVRRGDVCEATVVSKGDNDVVVDLGGKRDGVIPPYDLDRLGDGYADSLEMGDAIPVVVTRVRGRQGECVVSLSQGLECRDWLRARDLLDNEEVVEGEVTEVNRGGVLVPFGNLRGFVPNSHLDLPRGLRGDRLRNAKLGLVGGVLPLIVIEVNQRRGRLILSARNAGWRQRQQLLVELMPGEIRTGTVCNLVDFGAFVDLGGIDGLIHVSELDWVHVSHPSDVLSVGDRIEVYVMSVDRDRERIGLSRRRLLPDPWDLAVEPLRPGDVVEGKVASVVSYGAFIDIGEGVEGLAHVSEMPDGDATLSALAPGTRAAVRVLSMDRRRRRIALRIEPSLEVPI